jgi:uncharacterized protein (TIGR04255 family)
VTTRREPRLPDTVVSHSSHLPKYAKPPVAEVAVAVQFDELPIQPVHIGLLWQRWQDRYPKTEHHPPLGSVVELFGKEGLQRASLSLEAGFPAGRSWFVSDDGVRVMQIQSDKFIVNWRKLDTDSVYPSYDALRDRFVEELTSFLEFVSAASLGEFIATQCELTYVNHIESPGGWSSRSGFSRLLTTWNPESAEMSDLPPIENARLQWQYRMEEDSKPLGRLHVTIHPAARKWDNTPLIVMQLGARGAPFGSDLNGVLAFADKAHEWIVRGFTSLTTPEMHKVWERER